MDPKLHSPSCPDCDGLTRRELWKTVGGVAIASALPLSVLVTPRPVSAAEEAAQKAAAAAKPETLVKSLYDSLTSEQKSTVAFPFDHPLRSKVDNNWAIVKPRIREFFTADQQAMISDIFRGVHSEEYINQVLKHMQDDAGGLGNYHVALFGEPGSGKFEWVLSGRHCTIRCDGDSVEGAAFGGPIFYGHQPGREFTEKPDHPENVYWYQAKRANELFQALDGKQREIAVVKNEVPPERGNATVTLSGKDGMRPGLPVAEMTRDQKELVGKVMADLLLPFRKADADEAMKHLRANGGLNSLSIAFYSHMDLGNDGVWDVWRVEGPAMLWYFRGAPHVHTWVNIAAKA
jgi:hypothetical protein